MVRVFREKRKYSICYDANAYALAEGFPSPNSRLDRVLWKVAQFVEKMTITGRTGCDEHVTHAMAKKPKHDETR